MVKMIPVPKKFTPVPPRYKAKVDNSGHNVLARKFRPLYNTARWKALRMATLVKHGFRCQACGLHEPTGSGRGLVADHIIPHRHTSHQLFWDPFNLQCLCAQCHGRDKQREEAKLKPMGL